MDSLRLKRKQEARALGIRAEDYFSSQLLESGYAILARNYSVPGLGEIDIVANAGKQLLCLEIKARTVKDITEIDEHTAALAVKAVKRKRIYASMQAFCAEYAFGREYDVSYWLGIYYVNQRGLRCFSDLLACE